jgi:hypothetical protein
MAAALTVTGTVSGGTYAFDATTSKGFVLTNTGDADLTLGTIEISGAGFSLFSVPEGGPIAPLGTAGITVLRNASTGTAGVLTIPSDDPLSPYVVNLTGIASGISRRTNRTDRTDRTTRT